MEQILPIVMRYLHIVSATMAVGGIVFFISCFLPALRGVDEGLRGPLFKAAHDRFLRVLYIAIAGLVISGAYNWIMNASAYKAMGPKGNMLIGIKFLIALTMFALVIARGAGLIQPKNPRLIPMINIHLAAIVILLGTILRVWRG